MTPTVTEYLNLHDKKENISYHWKKKNLLRARDPTKIQLIRIVKCSDNGYVTSAGTRFISMKIGLKDEIHNLFQVSIFS